MIGATSLHGLHVQGLLAVPALRVLLVLPAGLGVVVGAGRDDLGELAARLCISCLKGPTRS